MFEDECTLELLQPKIDLLSRLLEQRVAVLPGVAEVRQRGMMVGIELVQAPPELRLGHRVTLAARHRGAVIRPLGDVVVLMPPLAISEHDLRRLVAITASSIAQVSAAQLSHAAAVTGLIRLPPPDRRWVARRGSIGAGRPGGYSVVGREVLLAGAAHRAEPGVRDVGELGAGRDPAVGVSFGRVVDEPARFTHVFHATQA